ncbi:receptor like protein kinase S.2 [Prunus yedoensis var. nudiflora]|uniref:Receptor like protein kinase S.2 n=1 Tax=Prunus yedoensis var. nudiflora TaxID=2094558 RepID=A0A314UR65_PRUYE|nr:receptor like protein kinase S.2 [Prunus yedoensis var. nudiflora]
MTVHEGNSTLACFKTWMGYNLRTRLEETIRGSLAFPSFISVLMDLVRMEFWEVEDSASVQAVLPSDGTVVAVKCLVERGEQFEKTLWLSYWLWLTSAIRTLSAKGWCVHETRGLKYWFSAFNWDRRRNIISGLAAALFYLHEQLETQIIHRDIKTSNVMLDSHYNARLGDFGLARWLEHELEYKQDTINENHQFGWQRRPELVEQLGRRAVDLTCPDDQIILLDWIRRLSDEGKLLQAGDNRIPDGSYKLFDMEHLFHLALLCTLQNPQSRPNMKWVVEALSGNIYGKLPGLPSFQCHPLYITLSSPTTTSTNNGSTNTRYTIATTNTTISSISSTFVTATGETIYATAEYVSSDVSSSESFRQKKSTFPMIETPREISYKEIISATNNFADSQRVAELDFGTAYQGFLNNRHHILVKRLGMKTCPALRARFSNELQNLGRLRHRNLVQLRGWCTEQGEMLVVYDYLADRLLSHLLFHHDYRFGNSILQWRHRYSIIKSLASAILYLHEEGMSKHEPKAQFFALAEFLTRKDHGHHATANTSRSVRGIFGYMSPEYMESGEATPMADIYSFGIVMLEIISGQMAVDFRRPEVLLVKRVHEFEARKRPLEELADIS